MSFFPKNTSIADEIAESMNRKLFKTAINKQAEKELKIVKAAELLNRAAEILDETGLFIQAEVAVSLLESLAGKKKKKKNKKAPTKSKELSSEQMEKNYKEKGWAFNEAKDREDINSASDGNDQNCAACGAPKKDMNKSWTDEPVDIKYKDEPQEEDEEEFQDMLGKLDIDAPEDFEDEWDLKLDSRNPDQLSEEDLDNDYRDMTEEKSTYVPLTYPDESAIRVRNPLLDRDDDEQDKMRKEYENVLNYEFNGDHW